MTGKNASPTTRITVDEDGITTFTGKQLIDLPASNITPATDGCIFFRMVK